MQSKRGLFAAVVAFPGLAAGQSAAQVLLEFTGVVTVEEDEPDMRALNDFKIGDHVRFTATVLEPPGTIDWLTGWKKLEFTLERNGELVEQVGPDESTLLARGRVEARTQGVSIPGHGAFAGHVFYAYGFMGDANANLVLTYEYGTYDDGAFLPSADDIDRLRHAYFFLDLYGSHLGYVGIELQGIRQTLIPSPAPVALFATGLLTQVVRRRESTGKEGPAVLRANAPTLECRCPERA